MMCSLSLIPPPTPRLVFNTISHLPTNRNARSPTELLLSFSFLLMSLSFFFFSFQYVEHDVVKFICEPHKHSSRSLIRTQSEEINGKLPSLWIKSTSKLFLWRPFSRKLKHWDNVLLLCELQIIWQIVIIQTFPDWSWTEKMMDWENLEWHRAIFQS